MSLLVFSIVALALGPGIVSLAGARSWLLSLVDGFVIVTIGGIALIHILPHAVLSCGAWAFVGAALGIFGPAMLERRHAHHGDDGDGDAAAHRPALALALLGIVMHAFVDGSAFAEQGEGHAHGHEHGEHASGGLLGLAVVLHRVPEGLAIWWLLRRRRGGLATALLVLTVVAVATVLGARFGDALIHGGSAAVFSFVQAIVAGSMLHVMVHHAPDAPGRGEGLQIAPAVGALAGVALLLVVSASHPTAQRIAHEIPMGPTFATLALESAPALLTAYAAAGLVRAFLPPRVVGWLSEGGALSQSLKGLFVGSLDRVYSRGALPLYRSMIARGAPRAAALTSLIAAPELGLATLLLSWTLLGGTLTIVRGLAAVLTALVVGHGVARLARRPSRAAAPSPLALPAPSQPWMTRLGSGLRYGLRDAVDHTAPWILIGLALAAFTEPLVDGDAALRVSSWIEVPLFAALGVPMVVCASGATPLVAVFLHKGVSPGAAIAFLLTGPALDLATFGALRRLHGRRMAGLFVAAMVIVPTLIGGAVNVILPRDRPDSIHTAAHEPATTIEAGSLAVLVVLVAISLARHGPRHMVGQLVDAARRGAHTRERA